MRIRLTLHESYQFDKNDYTNQPIWFVTDNPHRYSHLNHLTQGQTLETVTMNITNTSLNA